MATAIDQLLKESPFTSSHETAPIFLSAMQEALAFHRRHSPFYGTFIAANGLKGKPSRIEDIPPLPIGIFKERRLISVPEVDIVKVTHSSATTSGTPSIIPIDAVTRDRQRLALMKIMASFLGAERRPFVIFDSRETLASPDAELSSRATTIRGLLAFSSGYYCVLNRDFSLNREMMEEACKKIGATPPVFFGVTTVLYEVLQKYKNDQEVASLFRKFVKPTILFSGGWKKLADKKVDAETFKRELAEFFGAPRSAIIDFYGMIEQPGVIYPECEYGVKHVPTYARALVRDLRSMQTAAAGEVGLLEVLSPLAHSYPGIALLTDDLGRIEGEDGCRCNRPGQFFSVLGRAPQADVKGCADTLTMPTTSH